jgi:uncharacterized protein YuzE
MKLELKENMYVRTKDGIIAKVDYIDDDTIFFDKELYKTYGDSINFLEKGNLERIVKASYDIIDILEVGDTITIDVIDKNNYPTIIGINFARIDNILELASIKDMLKNGSAKLLTIITHEQMEQMAYKVED